MWYELHLTKSFITARGAEIKIPFGEIFCWWEGRCLFHRKWALIPVFMLVAPWAFLYVEHPHIQLPNMSWAFPACTQIPKSTFSEQNKWAFPIVNWLATCNCTLSEWDHYLTHVAVLLIILNTKLIQVFPIL